MHIRLATLNDYQALEEFEYLYMELVEPQSLNAFKAYYANKEIEYLLSSINDGKAYVLVENDKIAGSYRWFMGNVPDISNIILGVEYRGKGLAQLLLSHFEQTTKDISNGVYMLSGVVATNRGARKLYERMGYRAIDIGHEKFNYHKP
jgi:GNAT superfamily N-acetyltransferase